MVSGGGHTRCTAEAWEAVSVSHARHVACLPCCNARCLLCLPSSRALLEGARKLGYQQLAPPGLAAANIPNLYHLLCLSNVHSSIFLSADQSTQRHAFPVGCRACLLLASGLRIARRRAVSWRRQQHVDQKHMHHASSRWRASDCDDVRRMQRALRPGRRTGSSVKRVAMCQLDSRTTACLASQLQGTGCYRSEKPSMSE